MVKEQHIGSEGHVFSIEQIPKEQALSRLGFTSHEYSPGLIDSITASDWYAVDGGRIITEVRNPDILVVPRPGMIKISDLDDTIMSATRWHANEYLLMAQFFIQRGLLHGDVNDVIGQMKNLYESSKLIVPGKAEEEARYTPMANIALLSKYSQSIQSGQSEALAYEATLALAREIAQNGGAHLDVYPMDSDISRILIDENPTAKYVYSDYVREVFSPYASSGPKGLHVIATRGAIEGPLGQIHKVHSSGIMEEGVDMTIYTNDLKSEVLRLIAQFLPWTDGQLTQFIDDNPKEVAKLLNEVKKYGIKNFEVAMVRHADAKRRDGLVEGFAPIGRAVGYNSQLGFPELMTPLREITSSTGETVVDIYSAA